MNFAPLILSLTVASASTATAAPGREEVPQAAVDAYLEGKKLFDRGEYENALDYFNEADRLHSAPDLHYNKGLCYQRLRRWQDAIDEFEAYLEHKDDPADRQDVEDRILLARTRLEQEQAAAAEQARREAAEERAARRTRPGDSGGASPIDDGAPQRPGRGLIIAGSTLLAVGGATAIGTGVGFGVVVSRRNAQLDEILDEGNPEAVPFEEAQDINAEADTARRNQIIGASVGGAIAGIGVALLVAGLVKRSKANGGQASLSPWLGPRGAGAALSWRFR